MSDDEKIPPWRPPTDLDPALLDEDDRPKSKRVRRTKAQMAEAEARGEKVRRGIVKQPWPESLTEELRTPVTIGTTYNVPVPSLTPEAKARIIPRPVRVHLMFMKWLMVGMWLGYRNVSLALPLCCVKVSW